jgi:hypothetical protein
MKCIRTFGALMLGLGLCGAAQASIGSTVVFPQLRQAGDAGGAKTVSSLDTIIFRNQRVLTGTIVSETPDAIVFKGKVNGIELSTEYKKSEILEIKRGVKVNPGPVKADKPVEQATSGSPELAPKGDQQSAAPSSDPNKKRVYVINLVGEFGEEISEIPMRAAVKDAAKSNADIIIFKLNNKWEIEGGMGAKLPDEVGEFDGMRRAEEMMPIFRSEIPELGRDIRVVFWVEQAMGGAAFLPFLSKEIFFTSVGRMGGIGDLGEIFEGRGDEVVRQKQRSLRLGHAKGIAAVGGYDSRIVEAMSIRDTVLSVTFEDGKPKLLDRMPENPGEVLLTDDGKGINADTMEQRVANTGNDVLTLNAKIARDIGVSKGTADTRDELFFQMGIDRVAELVPEKQSEGIMKAFSQQLYNSKQRLKSIMEEIGEIPEGSNYNERTANRGRKIRLINEAIAIQNKFGNAISRRWMAENRIPGISELELARGELERKQLGDKRDRR